MAQIVYQHGFAVWCFVEELTEAEEEADFGSATEQADSENMPSDSEHALEQSDEHTYDDSYESEYSASAVAADAADSSAPKRRRTLRFDTQRLTAQAKQSSGAKVLLTPNAETQKQIAKQSSGAKLLLTPNAETQKRRAKQSSGAKLLLTPNAETQKQMVRENREDNSYQNLIINLVEFFQYIVLTTCSRNCQHEQSASPRAWATCSKLVSVSAWKHSSIPRETFTKLVEETFLSLIEIMFTDKELHMHKKIWDCMKNNKEGLLKDNNFVLWCIKIDRLKKEYEEDNATEHCQKCFAHTGTDHGEGQSAKTIAVQRCTEWYHDWLAADMLEKNTTPRQRQQQKYQFRQRSLTTQQSSWMNTMLRKNLGHAKAAFFIFHHGIPKLFVARHSSNVAPTAEEFAELFEQFIKWHASLLISLVEYEDCSQKDSSRNLLLDGANNWRQNRKGEAASAKAKSWAPFLGDMWSPE